VTARAASTLLARAGAALVLAASAGRPALAQTPAAPAAGPADPRLELSAGALYLQGYSLGSRDATLTPNQPGGGSFTLFATSSDLEAVPGFDGRLAYNLTRTVQIEGGLVFGQPRVVTRISGDTESAPDVTATETLQQYIVEGGAVLLLRRIAFAGGRAVPFVSGGIGYLRQLHENNELVETGRSYQAGVGLKYWISAGRMRLGVRGDARVYVLEDGFTLEETPSRRTFGAGGVGVMIGF
jgi:hypothetical protein